MKAIKSGLSTARKYPDRPMNNRPDRELTPHHLRHPNDKNEPRQNKGVQWAKSRKTEKDKKLAEFYKTHVYTWVSENRRAWVPIAKEEEE